MLGVFVGFVLEVVFFSVDYSRTENVQFEDDEYYYYVKAIPKIGVSVPDKKVKHITERQPGRQEEMPGVREGTPARKGQQSAEGMGYSQAESERNTEEILLTRSLSRELGLDQNRQNDNNGQ